MDEMSDSILLSIKKSLGITYDYTHFDLDIIQAINSVFSILTQLGVGPSDGFKIVDETAKWSEYLNEDLTLNLVQSYMFGKVRLIFDPPASSTVTESMNRMLSELEWRIANSPSVMEG